MPLRIWAAITLYQLVEKLAVPGRRKDDSLARGHTGATTDPTAQSEVFELVYPLLDPPPAQHAARSPAAMQPAAETGPAAERPGGGSARSQGPDRPPR